MGYSNLYHVVTDLLGWFCTGATMYVLVQVWKNTKEWEKLAFEGMKLTTAVMNEYVTLRDKYEQTTRAAATPTAGEDQKDKPAGTAR